MRRRSLQIFLSSIPSSVLLFSETASSPLFHLLPSALVPLSLSPHSPRPWTGFWSFVVIYWPDLDERTNPVNRPRLDCYFSAAFAASCERQAISPSSNPPSTRFNGDDASAAAAALKKAFAAFALDQLLLTPRQVSISPRFRRCVCRTSPRRPLGIHQLHHHHHTHPLLCSRPFPCVIFPSLQSSNLPHRRRSAPATLLPRLQQHTYSLPDFRSSRISQLAL